MLKSSFLTDAVSLITNQSIIMHKVSVAAINANKASS